MDGPPGVVAEPVDPRFEPGRGPRDRESRRVRARRDDAGRARGRHRAGWSAYPSEARPPRLGRSCGPSPVRPRPGVRRRDGRRGRLIRATRPVPRLNTVWASAVRFTAALPPSAPIPAAVVVPTFWPTTSAAAWPSPMAPASTAARVVATAALEDCMTTVITTRSIRGPSSPGSDRQRRAEDRTRQRATPCRFEAVRSPRRAWIHRRYVRDLGTGRILGRPGRRHCLVRQAGSQRVDYVVRCSTGKRNRPNGAWFWAGALPIHVT